MTTTTPSFCLCPLSLTVMESPVCDSCGHSFEESAIRDWLNNHSAVCPISRKPLDADADLQPNHALAERIEQWKWQRDIGNKVQEECDKVVAIDESQIAQDDEDDDDDDRLHQDDIETLGTKRKHCQSHRHSGKYRYQPIKMSIDFMLLPQERHLLELVLAREEAQQKEQKRKRTLWILTMTLVFLASLMVGAARVLTTRTEGRR